MTQNNILFNFEYIYMDVYISIQLEVFLPYKAVLLMSQYWNSDLAEQIIC